MTRGRLHPVTLLVLVISLIACSLPGRSAERSAEKPTPLPAVSPSLPATIDSPETEQPTATPVITPALTATPIPPPTFNEHGVRYCDYVPGVSVPAQMPPEVADAATPTPYPTATLPSPAAVDAATTERQLAVYRELWEVVRDNYVDPTFGGSDWEAIGEEYETLIRQGLSDEGFTAAMKRMIGELGDEHSHYESAAEVEEQDRQLAGQNDYVGIGALVQPIEDGSTAVILSIFPGSPAEEAGLRSHDLLLAVDGGPVMDEDGVAATLGPEGTPLTLTVQRPGEQPHDITINRRRVTGGTPINYCLVPETRIGYIYLPTFFDETIDDQTRAALEQMTADGPLEGLILDNRMNQGGADTVMKPIVSLFVGGEQGYFVSRDEREPLEITPEDIGGSQTVPLVVLVGRGTASFGEISSGVLGHSDRATLIGETTLGNVELLHGFTMSDGSRVWLATDTFQPPGEPAGIWEETGIIPDIVVPSRWDLFVEGNDPALAAAVDVLDDEN